MKIKPYFLFFFFFFFEFTQAQQWFDEAKLLKHVEVLASDSMEGRGTGTEGEQKAARYISSQFGALNLMPLGENGGWFQSFPFKAGEKEEVRTGFAQNVIAFLDNGAPLTVVIGAHYDHLGLGHDENSLAKDAKGKIHHGADDNASGVAGTIALANYFVKNNRREKFNFLFICFSGEELGLIGSKHFANNPTIDLTTISFMINMDMIGRLKQENPVLSVSGTGTAADWEDLLKKMSNVEMTIKTDSAGIGPSDHTSFYHKEIPALHFFTGAHSDYHTPDDILEKINSKGMQMVLQVIVDLIESLEDKEKLKFLQTRNTATGRARFKVSLGIMPSYTSSDKGVLVESVSDGKPAQAAGITAGDVILKLGEHEIKDIQDYMKALGTFEKGQETTVEILRAAAMLKVKVIF